MMTDDINQEQENNEASGLSCFNYIADGCSVVGCLGSMVIGLLIFGFSSFM